ncbi:MAG TPA: nucleotidyltransferase domain-containing protein [Actinomycetota bacterium]|nr:nucleotidyltransferase domain-containing protein [Actinomycetota bacterium]
MVEIVERRRAERERLLAAARSYVDRLGSRIPVLAAAVVGSVARGDFNVWSDIDVVVVAEDLPERPPERASILTVPDAPGVPIGFTPDELVPALGSGNRLAVAVNEEGVILRGVDVFRALSDRA